MPLGRVSSSTAGSAKASALAAASSSRPSAASASVKTISTWVKVSSEERMSAIHLRLTRSSTTERQDLARVKCIVS
ncbi:MAG: hypothetical protein ACYDD6_12870 [Acidimicrobiales bacterium]